MTASNRVALVIGATQGLGLGSSTSRPRSAKSVRCARWLTGATHPLTRPTTGNSSATARCCPGNGL